MFMGFNLTWVSNLRYKISLSTMEAEYTSSSQYMRELIGIRKVIKYIQTFVISGKTHYPKDCTHSKKTFLNDIPPSKF